MGAQELRKEFQSILRDGFDEEFIEWCVNEFDSHEFTEEQLPSARLYLPYLRQTMKFLSGETPETLSRIEHLISALQIDEKFKTDNVIEQASHLVKASGLNEDVPSRALSLGLAIYVQGMKKAGFYAGSYMKLFVEAWLLLWK